MQFGPPIVTNGLQLCLDAANRKSYSGTGNNWKDLSGNNNNGTLINSPLFDGRSFSFDGTNEYIGMSQQVSLSAVNGFSFSLWIKVPSNQISAGWNYLLSDRDTGGTPSNHPGDYEIGIYGSSSTSFLFKDNVASPNSISVYLSPNTWTNIVWGQNSSYQPFIYKNGVLATSLSNTFGNGGLEFSYLFTRESISNPLKCDCANIQVYNRTLSSDEILQNYNATKSRFGL